MSSSSFNRERIIKRIGYLKYEKLNAEWATVLQYTARVENNDILDALPR